MSGQRGKQVHDVNAASQGLVFPPGAATKTGRQNQTQSVTSHQPGCGHTDSVSRSALGPTQLLSDLQKCLGNTECQTSSEKIHSPSTKTHSAGGGSVDVSPRGEKSTEEEADGRRELEEERRISKLCTILKFVHTTTCTKRRRARRSEQPFL